MSFILTQKSAPSLVPTFLLTYIYAFAPLQTLFFPIFVFEFFLQVFESQIKNDLADFLSHHIEVPLQYCLLYRFGRSQVSVMKDMIEMIN